jgi:hypothetical protein
MAVVCWDEFVPCEFSAAVTAAAAALAVAAAAVAAATAASLINLAVA